MSKEEIFRYFYTNNANLGIKSTLFIMATGLLIGAILYFTYYVSYRGVAYNQKFNLTLVISLLISVVIMLMISSNIVLSLGMVGALSIVRFRTAVKDSRDTIFLFWAIAEGLCVGSQNSKLALVSSLFIAAVIIAASLLPKIFQKYMLIVTGGTETIDIAQLMQELNPYVLDSKLRTANKNQHHQEYIFELRTKGELNVEVIEQLKQLVGVESVNYLIESGETVG